MMSTAVQAINPWDDFHPPEPADLLLQEADLLKCRGQHQAAVDFLVSHYDSLYERYEYYEELGDNYLALGQHEACEKALLYALGFYPAAPNTLYLLGFLYSTRGDHKTAIDLFHLSEHACPNHPELLRCLGWSTAYLGQVDRGLLYLAQAREIAPAEHLIWLDSAVVAHDARRYNEALHFAEQSVALAPSVEAKAKAHRILLKIKEHFTDAN